jgi:prepilin-type N-terminal cleavage/methylation domain-containing protein
VVCPHSLPSDCLARRVARPRACLSVKVRASRGFTLIELMVVVIIISVVAVIALPAINNRMRDRRTQAAAQEVSTIYRNARLRALGRGAAVLVRYNSGANGTLEVREAVRTAGACLNMPTSDCRTPAWTNADSRVIGGFAPANTSGFEPMHLVADAPPPLGGSPADMDVCFTPLGRTFVRYATNATFNNPLTGVPVIHVWREDSAGAPVGLTRNVLIPPNGVARQGTAQL